MTGIQFSLYCNLRLVVQYVICNLVYPWLWLDPCRFLNPWNPWKSISIPMETHTQRCEYGFLWVWVWVFLKYPGVIHGIPYESYHIVISVLKVDLPLHVIIPVSTWQGGSTPPLCNIIPVLTWGGSIPPLHITIPVSTWWGGSTTPLRIIISVSTWGGSITIPVSTWWGGSTPPLHIVIPVSTQWEDQSLLSALLFSFWWSEEVYPCCSSHFDVVRWGRPFHPLLYILNIVYNNI